MLKMSFFQSGYDQFSIGEKCPPTHPFCLRFGASVRSVTRYSVSIIHYIGTFSLFCQRIGLPSTDWHLVPHGGFGFTKTRFV
jgi:hypothetical protein